MNVSALYHHHSWSPSEPCSVIVLELLKGLKLLVHCCGSCVGKCSSVKGQHTFKNTATFSLNAAVVQLTKYDLCKLVWRLRNIRKEFYHKNTVCSLAISIVNISSNVFSPRHHKHHQWLQQTCEIQQSEVSGTRGNAILGSLWSCLQVWLRYKLLNMSFSCPVGIESSFHQMWIWSTVPLQQWHNGM